MSALAADSGTASVVRLPQPLPRLFRKNRGAVPQSAAVAPADYIPYSTADMWRSSRRTFTR
jgi:hypothetical protein